MKRYHQLLSILRYLYMLAFFKTQGGEPMPFWSSLRTTAGRAACLPAEGNLVEVVRELIREIATSPALRFGLSQ